MQSASQLTSASIASTNECDLSSGANDPIAAANSATCNGYLAPSATFPASGTTGVTAVLSEKGSATATAGSLTATGCGVVSLADSAASPDPMLVRGATITYAQSGPLTASTAIGFNGSSAFAADAQSTTYTSSSHWSEAIWFKTSSYGTLMGFNSSSSNNSSSEWDRMLWVDASGKVVFGVYPGSSVELTSPSAYNNGAWHLAVGTVTTTGMSLSIDGTQVASNTTTTYGQAYTGYWHVGWDNESSGWSDPPTSLYFNGSLADAAVFPALSSAQISTLYGAGTQTAWASDLTSDGAVKAWTLGDSGTTAYTSAVPNVTPLPCAFVDVTIGDTGSAAKCAAPSSASACGAPSSLLTLATLPATNSFTQLVSPSQSVTVTVTLARDATNTVGTYPYATGLHVTDSLALVASDAAFNATLTWPSANIVL
jgi:hypothetical protein